MEEIYISEATYEALEQAAQVLADRLQIYPHLAQRSLARWLEVCVEELAAEAVWHCAEGDRSLVLNRRVFEQAVWKVRDERIKLAA